MSKQKVLGLINSAQSIVVVQADNPDGDSMASALALENILGELGKDVHLYCGVNVPSYLHYIPGWDRVEQELPNDFDLSLIVDASVMTLFDSIPEPAKKKLQTTPNAAIDHHQESQEEKFSDNIYSENAVATSQIIYELAVEQQWPISLETAELIAIAIMSDSLGLSSEGTTARSVHIIGELVERGVSLAKLEKRRKELMKKSQRLTKYKGQLLQRIEYFMEGRIASISIPWEEIKEYSPEYNPPMLVMEDMKMVEGVDIVIAFKTYNDGRITGKIRTNYGIEIAADLAEQFGGGGHKYAAGFKVTDGRPYDEVKNSVINACSKLLGENDAAV